MLFFSAVRPFFFWWLKTWSSSACFFSASSRSYSGLSSPLPDTSSKSFVRSAGDLEASSAT